MSKKNLTLLASGALLLGSLAVAGPAAAAYDPARAATCEAVGGEYRVGGSAAADRCIVVTSSEPVVVGGETAYTDDTVNVGDRFDGVSRHELDTEAATTNSVDTFGDWAEVGRQGALLADTCAAVGKGKAPVVTCQYELTVSLERIVTRTTTTTTPVEEVTPVLQQVDTLSIATTPQTSHTTVTTLTRKFSGSELATGPGSSSTDVTVVDEPLAPAVVATVTGSNIVEVGERRDSVTPTTANGGIGTSSVNSTAYDSDVTTVGCVRNPGKGDRENACPAA